MLSNAVSADSLRLVSHNVGSGDCTSIQTNNSIILIDVGPAGFNNLVPWLERQPRPVTDIFITHNHEDHVGGLPAILKSRVVSGLKRVWTLTHPEVEKEHVKLFFNNLEKLHASRRVIWMPLIKSPPFQPLTVWTQGQYRLDLVYPEYSRVSIPGSVNNTGAILQLSNQDRALMIWAGDNMLAVVSANTERVKWLLLPHHGHPDDHAETAAQLAVVALVEQQIQVSVGQKYPKHPSKALIRAFTRDGRRCFCTQLKNGCTKQHRKTGFQGLVSDGPALLLPADPSTKFCRGTRALTLLGDVLTPVLPRNDSKHAQLVGKFINRACR